ncbi:14524_t:CDS:2, partial [Cetraspora pellucida]
YVARLKELYQSKSIVYLIHMKEKVWYEEKRTVMGKINHDPENSGEGKQEGKRQDISNVTRSKDGQIELELIHKT